MDFFTAMRVSASGLSVQRTRMNVTSSNLANVETTRTPEGGPYKKRSAVVAAVPVRGEFGAVLDEELGETLHGSEVVSVASSTGPGRLVYDPSHPDANDEGYVEMPDVNVIDEMVDMLTASRSYEANVTALKTLKDMARSALDIGE